MANPITQTGTVTEITWTNPHVQLYYDVKDDHGKAVTWIAELTNPRALAARIQQFQSWAPRVRVITGDSHQPRIWEEVSRTLALGGDKLDFLFIDGDHSYEGVKADFEDYRKFVRPGGLVAFHDIKDTEHHRYRGCFVAKFWQELKGEKREFCADSHWGGIGVVTV